MKTMVSPSELGENLARLVWESFADFLEMEMDAAEEDPGVAVPRLSVDELLIFCMWVHTRACQQVFAGRGDPAALKAVLDAMHLAVFEDLEAHGLPHVEVPLFEQRVSARYADYYQAAGRKSGTVAEVAARFVSTRREPPAQLAAALAECTTATAGPLRDFLEDLELDI